MPEAGETNTEIANELLDNGGTKNPQSSRSEFRIEILEAIILGLVAVATAWSGYQAAEWDGYQAELFAESSRINVEASTLTTYNAQELLYNTNTLSAWMNARFEGNEELEQFYGHRFLEEYQIAFDAWIKTDPFNNSQAPLGPVFMPEYRSSKLEEANRLTSEASAKFSLGTKAGGNVNDYIRNTVFLATVLVLIAISQRFKIRSVRTGLLILSSGLLLFGMVNIIMLPRY